MVDRRSEPTDIPALFSQALELHRSGRLDEAGRRCDEILRRNPAHFDALFLRGVMCVQTGRPGQAVPLIDRAIALNPNFPEAHFNRGLALSQQKRHEDALASYDRAIALRPNYANAHNNRGHALHELKRHPEAIGSLDRAITLNPSFAQAHYIRALALGALGRHVDAVASLDRAIVLNPRFAQAHNARGLALGALGRHEEAVAGYEAAVRLQPNYAEAHNNLGAALQVLQRYGEALASYDRAIALKPDDALAHNNRGTTLQALGRIEDAVASCEAAIALKPDYAKAYSHLGALLVDLKRYADAEAAYAKAVALDPDSEFTLGSWLHTRMKMCDWRELDASVARIVDAVEAGRRASPPFPLLSLPISSATQRKAAQIWVEAECPPVAEARAFAKRAGDGKIRLGYFSADFHRHATSALIAGLFEAHDRSRFELIGFSFGASPRDVMYDRVSRAFDRFFDLSGKTDEDIAELARGQGLDIAIDLKGFTGGCRTKIFASRAAPVQVNYLGYPGTMAADYIDYVIADPVVIPEEEAKNYSEKIVYLPDSYQVNDSRRALPEGKFTRTELGLPERGVVFCCFNNNYKINPPIFDSWMRILQRVDGGVLWLLGDNPWSVAHLRDEAEARGVDPGRLVFAERMDLEDHLARHRVGDLFLDTWPYNAHTTASDALWTGLPVITRIGDAFAGRVAASLLHAVGLDELVVETPAAYEDLAAALACNPDELARVKAKLAANRPASPLFDTRLFTARLEAAYAAMYERHRSGLPLEPIRISP